MNLKTIAEHTIDTDLLSGGICIDVGCRGFQFSEAMRDRGCEVWAYDIEDMVAPNGIIFNKAAVTDQIGMTNWVDTTDQQAKYVSEIGSNKVESVNLNKVYFDIAIHTFKNKDVMTIDVLKLDCEGSEYAILSDPNFQPIPKQLSIEFHEHCFPGLHGAAFESCMRNLTRHYVPVQHERYRAHGAGENYWDSLFIRKDLL